MNKFTIHFFLNLLMIKDKHGTEKIDKINSI